MRTRISRLRSADPARRLGAQPDGRAERDLQSLVGDEPASAPLAPRRPAVGEELRRMPLLVTGAVLILVVWVSAAVLGLVHPRSGGTAAVRPSATGCHPVDVLPFQCGTYRSVFGVRSITGDTGGPAADPLTIWFARSAAGLVLHAVSANCFDATVPVRVRGSRIVRAGAASYDEGSCHGRGADERSWAYAWLNGALEFDVTGGGLAFDLRDALVTFEYEGVTPFGQKPVARNELHCVAAHVAPFSCGTYVAESGTGSLAFLGDHRYRLEFQHINAQLTPTLEGDCNALSPTLEVDGNTVLAFEGSSTAEACLGPAGTHDHAIERFFHGTLGYRVSGDLLTFTGPTASATFRLR